ncbi:MAG: hypothetical protein ACK5XV_09425 [Flavobacteriales bacterium]|jgi:hypothetical protein
MAYARTLPQWVEIRHHHDTSGEPAGIVHDFRTGLATTATIALSLY